MGYRNINWLALAALAILTTGNLPVLGKPSSSSFQSPTADEQKDRLRGGALFKKNCQSCHSTGTTGGCLGPVLAGEGARRSRSFIESRISSDRQKVAEFLRLYGHAELMPHMRVAPADARVLALYVASLAAPGNGFDVRGHAAGKKSNTSSPPSSKPAQPATLSLDAGKKLVYDRGCLMCHSFGGIGGQFAPSFDGIGSRRSEEYISERISNAELLLGKSGREYGGRGLVMPPSSLSDADVANISTYLSSLK
ncbi:MAG: cytochrome c [Candidatus Melainabacteria bacterium]|nr:cytochrome c [Candidatus Melainabacteria bacterium]